MTTAANWAALTQYGDGILDDLSAKLPPYVVVTTKSPWRLTKPHLTAPPLKVFFATALQRPAMDAIVAAIPGEARIVVGIGSGLSTETAKYVAWQSRRALVQVPTVTSSNAVLNLWVEVNDGDEHLLPEAVLPETILVDFGLIRRGPPEANRSGVGDVACIQTALFDWRLMTDRGLEPGLTPAIEAGMLAILERLEDQADTIGALTDDGIRAIFELFLAQADMKARFAAVQSHGMSGADHLFAWNLEKVTGQKFLHGEAVALGTVLMAALQGNDPARARRTLERARVRFRPTELGISWDAVLAALRTLPAFADAMRPFHALARATIADQMPIDDASLDKLQQWIS